ncbi:transposase [Streptomyces atratus]|uniref:transposase n=1 Tax=Streptomyces atratus TaxID=1893 RepID=UPI003F53F720
MVRPTGRHQWAHLAPCLPCNDGKAGRPFADHRCIINGIIYWYRTGIPMKRSAREVFGPSQTVWRSRPIRGGSWWVADL